MHQFRCDPDDILVRQGFKETARAHLFLSHLSSLSHAYRPYQQIYYASENLVIQSTFKECNRRVFANYLFLWRKKTTMAYIAIAILLSVTVCKSELIHFDEGKMILSY